MSISVSESFNPKFCFIPGKAIPTIIVFLPLSTTFPEDIVILLALVLSIIVPNITTKGVYIFSVLPLILTWCSSLFVYWITISTFPDFPATSSAEISFPSNL